MPQKNNQYATDNLFEDTFYKSTSEKTFKKGITKTDEIIILFLKIMAIILLIGVLGTLLDIYII